MKLAYILPVLLALPMGAFAASNSSTQKYFKQSDSSSDIRFFVGYNIGLGNMSVLKAKIEGVDQERQNDFNFNDNNAGDFVFGVEFSDIVAVSLNPSFDTSKAGDFTTKTNEVNFDLDIYLTQGKEFKPYFTLEVGYITIDDYNNMKTSGALFGAGLGLRNYVSDNVFFSANLKYIMSNKMNIEKIGTTPVNDASMTMNGLELNVGVGYRF